MAPAKMKAAVTCGEPDRVEVREIDVPKPGPTDVLVKVVAAATNPADCKYFRRDLLHITTELCGREVSSLGAFYGQRRWL